MSAGVQLQFKRTAKYDGTYIDGAGKTKAINSIILADAEPLYITFGTGDTAHDFLIVGDGTHTIKELYEGYEFFAKVKDPKFYGKVEYDTYGQGCAVKPDENNIRDLKGNQIVSNTEYVTDVKNAIFKDQDKADTALDTKKMDKANPTGTGSLSINRRAGTTIGSNSVALGTANTASGSNSTALGLSTTASGIYSVATGQSSTASGIASFAEGMSTEASGKDAHAEGGFTTASGEDAHAEGNGSIASAVRAHAEGMATLASSENQHVQGRFNIEDKNNKFADIVGNGSNSARSNAYALDWAGNGYYKGDVFIQSSASDLGNGKMVVDTTKIANDFVKSTAYKVGDVVWGTISSNPSGIYSKNLYICIKDLPASAATQNPDKLTAYWKEINLWNSVKTIASDKMDKLNPTGTGYFSLNRKASTSVGNYSVAVGDSNTASGIASFAEGWHNVAAGNASHVEGGWQLPDESDPSKLIDYPNIANAIGSHAEGGGNTIDATAIGAHAEGGANTVGANAIGAHVEGGLNTVSGRAAHAEGGSNIASAEGAHAEGGNNKASGIASHVEGILNVANKDYQHVQGRANIENPDSSLPEFADVVGNGSMNPRTGVWNHSNAYALDWSGNGYYNGNVYADFDFDFVNDNNGTDLIATQQKKILANVGKIAPIYDSATAYTIGQMVIYNNKVYRCKANCTGVTPPGSSWEESSVADTIDNLEASLTGAASKTITKLTESNGIVSATFSDISIDYSKVTGSSKATPSNDAPNMDGTASGGSKVTYSRSDHVHPSDTSRASTSAALGDVRYDSKKLQKKTVAASGYTDIVSTTTLKSDMGLNNVTNESKATMFTSPQFTGDPKAVTTGTSDNDTSIATTAFVHNVIANNKFIYYQNTEPSFSDMTAAEKAMPRIWVNSDTAVMKIWNGSAWKYIAAVWGSPQA